MLESAIFALAGEKWGRSLGEKSAKMTQEHAERYLYRTKGQAKEKGTWIGFVQNAWPCNTAGRDHCTGYFKTKSAIHNFVFNCTNDRGTYASEHGKSGAGTVYIYGGVVYYSKSDVEAKVPEGETVPDPPAG